VPVMLAYPESGGNGIGFVELPNTVGIDMTPNIRDRQRLGRAFETWPAAGIAITEGYLFREGYVYMAVQWDKAVTDVMGPQPPDGSVRRRLSYGSIERAADRYEIMRAAARWLREPSAFVTSGAPALAPQEHVIGYGFSQSGALPYSFLDERLNEDPEGKLYSDGLLPHGVGNYRYPIIEEFPYWGDDIPSGRALPGGAKVLALEMETDVQVFGAYYARDPDHGTEDEDPHHVMWELAGVSHLPQTYSAIDRRRAYSPQNPIDFRSVTRAAIHQLTRWVVDGTEPYPFALRRATDRGSSSRRSTAPCGSSLRAHRRVRGSGFPSGRSGVRRRPALPEALSDRGRGRRGPGSSPSHRPDDELPGIDLVIGAQVYGGTAELDLRLLPCYIRGAIQQVGRIVSRKGRTEEDVPLTRAADVLAVCSSHAQAGIGGRAVHRCGRVGDTAGGEGGQDETGDRERVRFDSHLLLQVNGWGGFAATGPPSLIAAEGCGRLTVPTEVGSDVGNRCAVPHLPPPITRVSMSSAGSRIVVQPSGTKRRGSTGCPPGRRAARRADASACRCATR